MQDQSNHTTEISQKHYSIQSFELGLEAIDQILTKLQDPKIALDNALSLYKKGLICVSDLETVLNNAKLEFETIEANLNQTNSTAQDN